MAALPIMVFEILIALIIGLFLFGARRQSMKSGFIFILLSALTATITGLFLLNSGLQLNDVSNIISVGEDFSITYATVTATAGSPIWVIGELLTFGGVALMVLTLALTWREKRIAARQYDSLDYAEE